MFWVLSIGGGVLAVVVVLLAAMIVVGKNLSPEFQFQTSREFSHSPDQVWAVLNDLKSVPVSGTQCRSVEAFESDNRLPAWREDMGASVATIETVESDAPNRALRRFSDSVVPMTMRCQYVITPTDAGCRVDVAVDGRIESGTWHVPMFRVIVKIFGMAKKGQDLYLSAIADHLEKA